VRSPSVACVRPQPRPPLTLHGSGPEKEAEIEAEVMEFEEEGGLAVSLVVWVLALVGPLSLLVYLRLKTSLLGATPPTAAGSKVLSALVEGAGKGASSGPGASKPSAAKAEAAPPGQPSAAALSKAGAFSCCGAARRHSARAHIGRSQRCCASLRKRTSASVRPPTRRYFPFGAEPGAGHCPARCLPQKHPCPLGDAHYTGVRVVLLYASEDSRANERTYA